VVSYAGPPDLAADWLSDVRAPTLLIVGGEDRRGAALNRAALDVLRCRARIVVPRATTRFEEPDALSQAVRLATA
jgi:hypothetical protein